VHGTADTAVHIQESRHLRNLLNAAGVDVTLTAIEGKEHSFDYESDAGDRYGGKDGLFDMIAAFLMSRLRKSYT
jgi:dipeptidyl aminopeptidase/acylaminoacyl peptidase